MNRTTVVSTRIEDMGYDPESQTAEIAFVSGGIYRYFNVPEDIYYAVLNAASVGRAFDQLIKGSYDYERIS